MKSLYTSFFAVLSLFALVNISCAENSGAVKAPGVKQQGAIATIEFSKIMDQDGSQALSDEWRDEIKRIQGEAEKQQGSLASLQKNLEKTQKELEAKEKEGKKITEDEQKAFLGMYQELQMKTNGLQKGLEAQFMKLQQDMKTKIDAAAKTIATKKGYEYVMPKEVFVYSNPVHDITKEVVAELNNKYAAEKRAKKMTASEAGSKTSKTNV